MLDKLDRALAVLICASFIVLAVPVGATDHNPGVQVGYWVEYGNFVTRGPVDSENLNATKWMKMEVTLVVGNRVTVHTSRMFKNDTFQDGSDYVFDVATNETDRSANATDLWSNYLMVAGNLAEGSDTHLLVALPEGLAAMFINKTETKDLLGMNRTVNLVDRNESLEPYYDYEFHLVYDQATGMLLELNCSLTSRNVPSTNEMLSYSATEINTTPKSSDNTLTYAIVTIAAVIIVVIAVALVIRQRRKARTVKSVQKASKKKTRK
jgi:hypothetical protein